LANCSIIWVYFITIRACYANHAFMNQRIIHASDGTSETICVESSKASGARAIADSRSSNSGRANRQSTGCASTSYIEDSHVDVASVDTSLVVCVELGKTSESSAGKALVVISIASGTSSATRLALIVVRVFESSRASGRAKIG
jgi:hypothetical protein